MSRTKVVIADDHSIVRQGLKSLFEATNCIEVVGEASDASMAMDMVQKQRPDILILDISMPGINGLQALKLIRETSADTKVLIVSMHSDGRYIQQALENGASGYFVKDDSSTLLLSALNEIAKGGVYLSPSASTVTHKDTSAPHASAFSAQENPYDLLTAREKEVLQYIAEGLTNIAIANRLRISSRTVEVHRANLQRKLNIHSQAELIRFAIEHGLIE